MTKDNYKKAKEILTWVKQQIKAHPRRYNQADYCGTKCCIGGWIDIRVRGARAHYATRDGALVQCVATKALGMSEPPWLLMWSWGAAHNDWNSETFRKAIKLDLRFAAAKTYAARAAIGCQAINLWLREQKELIKA